MAILSITVLVNIPETSVRMLLKTQVDQTCKVIFRFLWVEMAWIYMSVTTKNTYDRLHFGHVFLNIF